MNLALLRSFCAVADTEHVGRAAAALHVSASPLSRQIRALEDELGLALFVRERQRIRLTDTGRWFLGEARHLLEHAGRVERDVRDRASGRAGSVTVGFVSAALWSDALPNALGVFGRAHPRVRVALKSAPSREQAEAVRAGHLDLGFVHGVKDDRMLVVREIRSEPLCLVIPAAHPLAAKRGFIRGISTANAGSRSPASWPHSSSTPGARSAPNVAFRWTSCARHPIRGRC